MTSSVDTLISATSTASIRYRTIVLNRDAQLVDGIKERLDIIGSFVRNLCIGAFANRETSLLLLKAAHHVENLACWINDTHDIDPTPPVDLAQRCRPRSLFIRADAFFGRNRPLDFTKPVFQNVTHLHINCFYAMRSLSPLKQVESLESLTHFGIHPNGAPAEEIDTFEHILKNCTKLKVFILIDTGHIVSAVGHRIWGDVRLVRMNWTDAFGEWEHMVADEPHHWTRAEETIGSRRKHPA